MFDTENTQADPFLKTHLNDCYQCGKCTGGCPVASRMDYMPNQVVRMVQSGKTRKAIESEAIWQCVYCQTCSARCPKNVDCAGLMDALRRLAVQHAATAPSHRRTLLFHKAFLRSVRRNGRLNELELAGTFKATAFINDLNIPFLFRDAMLAPQLKARGKFHISGEKVRDRDIVSRIFDRCLPGN